METKLCRRCNQVKPIDEFRKDRTKKNGRGHCCTPCNRERVREYAARHREEKYKKTRAWKQANKEHLQEYGKRWRELNKESLQEWREANPHYNRVYKANMRATELGREGVVTVEEWHAICSTQNNRCAICFEAPIEELDHITAFCAGGTNSPENIQGLCISCHKEKTKEDRYG